MNQHFQDMPKDSEQRKELVRAGAMHWVHWVVVVLSILLTVGAWYFSKEQITQKLEERFHREADRVVELVKERMELYENALWGGVALYDASEEVTYPEWVAYANSLKIDKTYPGINGIGVIYNVQPTELDAYFARERRWRPDYRIHPEHDKSEYWPITYIAPAKTNRRAVGLDMAFETNRYTAILKSRDTGQAQLTGPIVLVQDSKKTPGFLFYAPFYKDGKRPSTVEGRRENTFGVTYAPFIMYKLLQGTLARRNRHVGIEISDGDELLYEDQIDDRDGRPLFRKEVDARMYGRVWKFGIWSNSDFQVAASSNQPYMILVGGILIDALLLTLFVLLSRANRKALSYADQMTEELRVKTEYLEQSNRELDDFAFVASHDLKEPLRGIHNYATFLIEDYGDKIDEEGVGKLRTLTRLTQRMEGLIDALLHYSRLGRANLAIQATDLNQNLAEVLDSIHVTLNERGVEVRIPQPLPTIHCDPVQIGEVFHNLITNAMKYNDKPEKWIEVGYTQGDGRVQKDDSTKDAADIHFYVRDNGIGIQDKHTESIFRIFKRLHGRDKFGGGTGAGLTIVKKIVGRHGGKIWVESQFDQGTTFHFTLPDAA